MKQLLTVTACSLLMTFGQMAHASPAEDAAFIADALITDKFQTMVSENGLRTFTDRMTGALSDRSVRIKDAAAYQDLMTLYYTAATTTDLREVARDMLSEQSPEALAELADYIRENPEGFAEEIQTNLTDIKDVPVTIEAAFGQDSIAEKNGTLSIVMGLAPAVFATTDSAEADLTAPFMADVLETDGVFQFPNRIYRKDLIAEIRAANP